MEVIDAFIDGATETGQEREIILPNELKRALLALLDDPQVQQKVVVFLRNRTRTEPSLFR